MNKSLNVIKTAVNGLVRSAAAYQEAVDAIRFLCKGKGSEFRERISRPLLGDWDKGHPIPEAPGKAAGTAARKRAEAQKEERRRARHAFISALSYLRGRAGLEKDPRGRKATPKPERLELGGVVPPSLCAALPDCGGTQKARLQLVRQVLAALAAKMSCEIQDVVALVAIASK
jgi:hypothetical protein